MRFLTASLVIAAALVAAAPAHAQRQSLADRVSALEIQSANDRGNTDLLNQVTQLRTEMQQLRDLVEQLQNENEKLKQTSRDQYLDLDGRLNRLEGGTVPVTPAAAMPPVAPPATSPAAPAASAERPPSVHGDVGAVASAGDERAAYNVAFDALKGGNYADSAQLFLSFLELYPNGAYSPNAIYWLGESYYVTQNYALAGQQFQALLDRSPTHDKAAGALLKLGLAQYGLKDYAGADATLNQVVQRYPGSDVARTADDRLRAMQIAGTR